MDETRIMFAVVVHLSLLCAKTVFGMEEALISLGCLVLVTLYSVLSMSLVSGSSVLDHSSTLNLEKSSLYLSQGRLSTNLRILY